MTKSEKIRKTRELVAVAAIMITMATLELALKKVLLSK